MGSVYLILSFQRNSKLQPAEELELVEFCKNIRTYLQLLELGEEMGLNISF